MEHKGESPLAPETRAVRLILAVHQSMDWDVWGSKRLKYWQILTDNIRSAAYTRSLVKFINTLCSRMDLPSLGRNAAMRQALDNLLRVNPEDERAMLRILRDETMTVVLEVRVWIEEQRAEAGTEKAEEGASGLPL